MIPRRNLPRYHTNKGAILIVCLSLLLVMTLLGVSTIDTSTMQSQMARNSLYARTLFQASLSEIENQRYKMEKELSYLEDITSSTVDISPTTYVGISSTSPGLELTAKSVSSTGNTGIAYQQKGAVVFADTIKSPLSGYSLGGSFTALNFEINVDSKVKNTGSSSNQTQGVKRAAPKQ